MKRWKLNMARSASSYSKAVVVRKSLPVPNGLDLSFNPVVDEASMSMSNEMQLAAKQRQVMSIAYGPGKNLLTTGFMLWMSGSSIQIFSIMMTGMALINPLKAIFSMNQTFAGFAKEDGLDLKMPKLIFLSLQLLSVAVAVYKCSMMGLLPLTSADWVSYLPEREYMEQSAIPL